MTNLDEVAFMPSGDSIQTAALLATFSRPTPILDLAIVKGPWLIENAVSFDKIQARYEAEQVEGTITEMRMLRVRLEELYEQACEKLRRYNEFLIKHPELEVNLSTPSKVPGYSDNFEQEAQARSGLGDGIKSEIKSEVIPKDTRQEASFAGRKALVDMPPEIIYTIMETCKNHHDNCSAVCLGLTRKTFYPILKRLYPAPISLSYSVYLESPLASINGKERIGITRLDTLIRSLFDPQYRIIQLLRGLTQPDSPHFLNLDVYGGSNGEVKEQELRERYEDYDCMSFSYRGVQYHLLPNPFNRGDEWYAEVYAILLKRETDYEGWSVAVSSFWKERVKRTWAWQRMLN